MKLKAILFDLDDTLYLERDFVKSGFRAVAWWLQQENGLPEKETFTRLWSMFTSGERGDLFDRLLGDDLKKKVLVKKYPLNRTKTARNIYAIGLLKKDFISLAYIAFILRIGTSLNRKCSEYRLQINTVRTHFSYHPFGIYSILKQFFSGIFILWIFQVQKLIAISCC